MLQGVPDLTLALLNEATQAWVEYEYNRKRHAETGEEPVARFLAGPDVTRPSPDTAALRLAFMRRDSRKQRKTDGTVQIEGRRFEVPNQYRHIARVELQYASWDLAMVYLVDEYTDKVLCRLYPEDKNKNASGLRRVIAEASREPAATPAEGMAPLLAKLIEQQANTGLPPPYLPKDEGEEA